MTEKILNDWSVVLKENGYYPREITISGVHKVRHTKNGYEFLDEVGGLIFFVPTENLFYHGKKKLEEKETINKDELRKMKEELKRLKESNWEMKKFIYSISQYSFWDRLFGFKDTFRTFLDRK